MRTICTITIISLIYNTLQAQCPEHYVPAIYSLIANGDFSEGNAKFATHYYESQNLYPEGYYHVGDNPNSVHDHFTRMGDHTDGAGQMLIVNGAPVEGQIVWQQTIAIDPETVYVFSTHGATVSGGNSALLQFSIDDQLLGEPFQLNWNEGIWDQFYEVWKADAQTEITISIVNRNVIRAGNDFVLDDLLFVPCVPEYANKERKAEDEEGWAGR